jgi:hypothetical protein
MNNDLAAQLEYLSLNQQPIIAVNCGSFNECPACFLAQQAAYWMKKLDPSRPLPTQVPPAGVSNILRKLDNKRFAGWWGR